VVELWVTFLPRKSIPIVGWVRRRYIVLLFEAVIDESLDDARLSCTGIAQQDQLEGALANCRGSYGHSNLLLDSSTIIYNSHAAVTTIRAVIMKIKKFMR
jgi:hypothetical protein